MYTNSYASLFGYIIANAGTLKMFEVGAHLYRLSTVDAHTDVLKPIHGKII